MLLVWKCRRLLTRRRKKAKQTSKSIFYEGHNDNETEMLTTNIKSRTFCLVNCRLSRKGKNAFLQRGKNQPFFITPCVILEFHLRVSPVDLFFVYTIFPTFVQRTVSLAYRWTDLTFKRIFNNNLELLASGHESDKIKIITEKCDLQKT